MNRKTRNTKKIAVLGLTLIITVLGHIHFSTAQETLVWRIANLAPTYIVKGEYQGQGNGDTIIQLLGTNLPEYSHEIEEMPLKRFVEYVNEKRPYCYPSFQKNAKRENILYYSLPSILTPGFILGIRKKDASLFGSDGSVSLADILQHKNLHLGIFAGRSYTPALDEIIKVYRNENHVYVRHQGDTTEGLVKMLVRERIDYILVKSPQFEWYGKTLGVSDKLIGLSIREAPAFYIGYVACTKTEWGREVIESINGVLQQVRGTEEYRKAIERWVGANQLEALRETYDRILLTTP